MPTVRSMLEAKGDAAIYSVACSDTVYHALEVMAEHQVGAVMVTDGDHYAGIFTERDYARKIILKGHDSRTTPLCDIMTTELVTVTPETSAEQCMGLMTKYHIRHLPVQDGEKLIGLVSMRDVMETIISTKQDRIERLESYILGAEYQH